MATHEISKQDMKINTANYKSRRERLFAKMPSDSLALLEAAPSVIRNGDTHYPYRQNSDFYYLTGFSEPNALLALLKAGQKTQAILFCRAANPQRELWEGPSLHPEQAVKQLGVDAGYAIDAPVNEIDHHLTTLFAKVSTIYYPVAEDMAFDRRILGRWLPDFNSKEAQTRPHQFIELRTLLHPMRMIKDAHEIDCMRKAARISAAVHAEVMGRCRPGLWEYQLAAEYVHGFMQQGCQSMAYPAIVAAGENACTLHYTANNAQLRDGDLMLVDAGAEFECYASDITRTYPINGRYTSPQQAIVGLVRETQSAIISQVKPGVTWEQLQNNTATLLTQGLIDLKILSGSVDSLMEQQAYKAFYPHSVGHWLGLDVHDVGLRGRQNKTVPFEPGMVLTIEPGLYCRSDIPGLDDKWKGIGVRIEDDILVTQNGSEILSTLS